MHHRLAVTLGLPLDLGLPLRDVAFVAPPPPPSRGPTGLTDTLDMINMLQKKHSGVGGNFGRATTLDEHVEQNGGVATHHGSRTRQFLLDRALTSDRSSNTNTSENGPSCSAAAPPASASVMGALRGARRYHTYRTRHLVLLRMLGTVADSSQWELEACSPHP
jgi:hypothetical protein